MTVKIISSQRFLDDNIVSQKIKDEDFEVQLSPVFTLDNQDYQVVTDGHHSLAAAKQAGVQPVFYVQNSSENDRIGLIESGEIDDFLSLSWIDSDWYDVETGWDIW